VHPDETFNFRLHREPLAVGRHGRLGAHVVLRVAHGGVLLGSEFKFEDRGRHALKGIDGEWPLFAVSD
jgi:hypothetical protein